MAETLDELLELSDLLVEHRRHKKELEDLVSGENKDIADIEMKMAMLMEEQELQNFTRSGQTFYRYIQSMPSVVDFDKFLSWLEEHGEAGIVKMSIHPSTLRSWYSQHQDDYAEELTAEKLLSVFQKVHIGVRKA